MNTEPASLEQAVLAGLDPAAEKAIVPHVEGVGLALLPDQPWWTDRQRAGLQQIGLAKAPQGDLLVFMHVAQRTGLDPFAKQIYMIARNTREEIDGTWQKVTKWTIQTGIDGFRLVARRASDRLHETLEYEDTLWCGKDGVWVDAWLHAGPPVAAKVTVLRHGKRFSSVALYREYVQNKANGDPNAMWDRMPSGQLEKCCEARALRKAFPHDLSGLYTDDEMQQADTEAPTRHEAPASGLGLGAALRKNPDMTVEGELVEEPAATPPPTAGDPDVPDEQRSADPSDPDDPWANNEKADQP